MHKHLVVDISAHGFGHVAQTTAVLNALHTLNPKTRFTIRTTAPQHIFDERLDFPVTLIAHQQDKGMIMRNALEVDVEASFQWYQSFHADYEQHQEQALKQLTALKPDLLFANVPYLSLDAAHLAGIPSLALCSLNWADIFKAYCGEKPEAAIIHQQIQQAYRHAECFMQATPSMPMDDLNNTQAIAPIAPRASKQTGYLHKLLNKPETARFVLVGLGGIGVEYPLQDWVRIDNVYWIFPDQSLYLQRDDFLPQSALGLSYLELLSNCNVLLTKTGYGSQTEAVIHQIPTVCVQRGDWPEEPYLFEWHKKHGEVSFIEWDELLTETFTQQIAIMLEKQWSKAAVQPTGAQEAAEIMNAYL